MKIFYVKALLYCSRLLDFLEDSETYILFEYLKKAFIIRTYFLQCKDTLKENIFMIKKIIKYDGENCKKEDIKEKANHKINNFIEECVFNANTDNKYNFKTLSNAIQHFKIDLCAEYKDFVNTNVETTKVNNQISYRKFIYLNNILELSDQMNSVENQIGEISQKICNLIDTNEIDELERSLDILSSLSILYNTIENKLENKLRSISNNLYLNMKSIMHNDNQNFEIFQDITDALTNNYGFLVRECETIFYRSENLNTYELTNIINKIHNASIITKVLFKFIKKRENSDHSIFYNDRLIKHCNSTFDHISINFILEKNTITKEFNYDLISTQSSKETNHQNFDFFKQMRYMLRFEPIRFAKQFEILMEKFVSDLDVAEQGKYFKNKKETAYKYKIDLGIFSNLETKKNIPIAPILPKNEVALKMFFDNLIHISQEAILIGDLNNKKLIKQYIQAYDVINIIKKCLSQYLKLECTSNYYYTYTSNAFKAVKSNFNELVSILHNDEIMNDLELANQIVHKLRCTTSYLEKLYLSSLYLKSVSMDRSENIVDNSILRPFIASFRNYRIHEFLPIRIAKCLVNGLFINIEKLDSLKYEILACNDINEYISLYGNLLEALGFTKSKEKELKDSFAKFITKNINEEYLKFFINQLAEYFATNTHFSNHFIDFFGRIVSLLKKFRNFLVFTDEDGTGKKLKESITTRLIKKIDEFEHDIDKNIKFFEQSKNEAHEVMTLILQKIIDDLRSMCVIDRVFSVYFDFLNNDSKHTIRIKKIISVLYEAISTKLVSMCSFKDNESYDQYLNYIIRLDEISESVKNHNSFELVCELQMFWFSHFYNEFHHFTSSVISNDKELDQKKLQTFIKNTNRVMNIFKSILKPKQVFCDTHLIYNFLPRLMFYEWRILTLKYSLHVFYSKLSEKGLNFIFQGKQNELKHVIDFLLLMTKNFEALHESEEACLNQGSLIYRSINNVVQKLYDDPCSLAENILYISENITIIRNFVFENKDKIDKVSIDEIIYTLTQFQNNLIVFIEDKYISEKVIAIIENKDHDQLLNIKKKLFDAFINQTLSTLNDAYQNKKYILFEESLIKKTLEEKIAYFEYFKQSCDNNHLKDFENAINAAEQTVKFVNNVIDYQNMELSQIKNDEKIYKDGMRDILVENKFIIVKLKSYVFKQFVEICEKINKDLTINTIYFIIDIGFKKNVTFIISESIYNSNNRDDLNNYKKKLFTVIDNVKSLVDEWKLKVEIMLINCILSNIEETKTKIIIPCIHTTQVLLQKRKDLFSQKLKEILKTDRCKPLNEEMIKLEYEIHDEKVQTFSNTLEKISEIDTSFLTKRKHVETIEPEELTSNKIINAKEEKIEICSRNVEFENILSEVCRILQIETLNEIHDNVNTSTNGLFLQSFDFNGCKNIISQIRVEMQSLQDDLIKIKDSQYSDAEIRNKTSIIAHKLQNVRNIPYSSKKNGEKTIFFCSFSDIFKDWVTINQRIVRFIFKNHLLVYFINKNITYEEKKSFFGRLFAVQDMLFHLYFTVLCFHEKFSSLNNQMKHLLQETNPNNCIDFESLHIIVTEMTHCVHKYFVYAFNGSIWSYRISNFYNYRLTTISVDNFSTAYQYRYPSNLDIFIDASLSRYKRLKIYNYMIDLYLKKVKGTFELNSHQKRVYKTAIFRLMINDINERLKYLLCEPRMILNISDTLFAQDKLAFLRSLKSEPEYFDFLCNELSIDNDPCGVAKTFDYVTSFFNDLDAIYSKHIDILNEFIQKNMFFDPFLQFGESYFYDKENKMK